MMQALHDQTITQGYTAVLADRKEGGGGHGCGEGEFAYNDTKVRGGVL